jgi:hypothetical protein
MEANEAADTITEAGEKRQGATDERARAREEAAERFRRRVAVVIGLLAALLAITALGADQARETTINSNIRASDTFAFYQAKNIRQTSYQLAANNLQVVLQTTPRLAVAARHAIEARIAAYTKTTARYEDDPTAGGQGKKQLLEQARHYEEERDRAERQLPSFNDAQALFQIAIVLGSVSIVASSRPLVLVAGDLGLVAFVLMLNGYLIHARLPLG